MESNNSTLIAYRDKYKVDLYNNELIAAISILSVLKHLKQGTTALLVLVLPIISEKKTLNFLAKQNTKIRSIEELILKNPETIVNFNNRYLSNLGTSINAIFLLKEMQLIQINGNVISYIDDNEIDFSSKQLGARLEKIINCSEKLSYILEDKIENIYLQLRVNL
ncbi:MAG: three component ABC system middle component [Solibacillus sp.]